MTHSLDELKAICEKASEGPWIDGGRGKSGTLPDLNAMPMGAPLYAEPTNDEKFIAVARTALPELIVENERLRAAMTGVLSGLDHKSDESFRVSIKAGYPNWNLAVHAEDMLKARAALEKKP